MHQPNSPIRLQLKYCERCGGLWLRGVGTDAVFCRPCALAMARAPGRERPGASVLAPKDPTPPGEARLEAALDQPLRGVCTPLFLRTPSSSFDRRIG